ncbi:bifunctional riboflavin kinase/FAD synthetase [Hyphobacterium sp.]|uniref:bifunctional riboflavin kinase/FAD synthetase n=1 Tax=Hyphobacterium sp. TaxID=2004662 RepID=UPI0037483A36
MLIVEGPPKSELPPCALALGNFDGVHEGHLEVLNATLRKAEDAGLVAAVAVFDPHPRRFFQPDSPPFRLMDDVQQADAIRDLGFERLHILPFNAAMSGMMPREFAETVLTGWVHASHVFVGADFEFGKGRSGDVPILSGIGSQIGFGVTGVALKAEGETKVSSSRIRQALEDGEIDAARDLLGRPWVVRGAVEHGDQRGRTIGFPTANISLGDYCRPAFGVYAVRISVDAQVHVGVANVGRRPTVDGTTERLEVHIFDFADDIYGQMTEVEFIRFLRPEQKFNGLDALKAQIGQDAIAARAVLAGQA